jgi:hypothetical protein
MNDEIRHAMRTNFFISPPEILPDRVSVLAEAAARMLLKRLQAMDDGFAHDHAQQVVRALRLVRFRVGERMRFRSTAAGEDCVYLLLTGEIEARPPSVDAQFEDSAPSPADTSAALALRYSPGQFCGITQAFGDPSAAALDMPCRARTEAFAAALPLHALDDLHAASAKLGSALLRSMLAEVAHQHRLLLKRWPKAAHERGWLNPSLH